MVFVAVSLVAHADVMFWPGAKMSTTLPKFENDARASLIVLAPTVIAAETRAGDELAALVFEFPAAIAYVTPELIEFCTAVSSAVETPPPSLLCAPPGLRWPRVTKSTPAMTPELVPAPWQFSTGRAKKRPDFPPPNGEPPIVPETCVPWPLQSM